MIENTITKNQIKTIALLKQKKYRLQNKQFVVEGKKGIEELLESRFELVYLVVSAGNEFPQYTNQLIATKEDFSKMSNLATPPECLAVFKIPENQPIDTTGLIVALDSVRDPGNLGTIIRLCDWFGIKQIVCSKETAELYNPKVVQATMGSITRVNVAYVDLELFLKKYPYNIYGTFINGENIYQAQLSTKGCIIMGNEANGISDEIEKLSSNRLTIPQFGKDKKTESLNVATATAIVLSEFRRQSY